jgi:chromate transporter
MSPWRLFLIFSRVSALTIGGGYAMIPVIQDFVVKRYRMVDDDEFIQTIVTAQTVPGVIAINVAMLLGSRYGGIRGAIGATLGAILPPFAIILVIASFFHDLTQWPLVDGFFYGAQVGVTVILANLSWQLIRKNSRHWAELTTVGLGALIILLTRISSVLIFFGCAGVVFMIQLMRRKKADRAHHPSGSSDL